MSELTEFLLARIAEDKAVAQESVADRARLDAALDTTTHDGPDCSFYSDADPLPHVSVGADRVLRECEAKRRIVEHHKPLPGEFVLCVICTETGPEAQVWPCVTLRALAAVYADHPDYRGEWKP